jgi:uncharacterized protein YegP (UPF0339 family)
MRRRPRATVYRDRAGRWRYRVKAGNGRICDAPEQSFSRPGYTIERVRKLWPQAIVTYERSDGTTTTYPPLDESID